MTGDIWRTCCMDPPWPEHGGGKSKRGADRHYDLVPVRKMPKLIIESGVWRPAESAHLWMWATSNYLADAIWLIGQLGFRYVTNAVWVKLANADYSRELGTVCSHQPIPIAKDALQIGLGQYMRHAHELLLFATRGDAMVPAPENRLPSVIFAERTEHSRKPDESYELIERVSLVPRLEMFARRGRPGWSAWGNEAPPVVQKNLAL